MIELSHNTWKSGLGFPFSNLAQAHDELGQALNLREQYLGQAKDLVDDWKMMFPSIKRESNPPFYLKQNLADRSFTLLRWRKVSTPEDRSSKRIELIDCQKEINQMPETIILSVLKFEKFRTELNYIAGINEYKITRLRDFIERSQDVIAIKNKLDNKL